MTKTALPLSPGQQDVLVEAALDAGGTVSVQRVGRRLAAPLPATLVERRWAEILTAYPALAPVVEWLDGQPVQRFGPGPVRPMQVHVVVDYDGNLPGALAAVVLGATSEGPDPATPFVDLLCIADQTGVREIVLTYHRLVLDDSSAEMLLADLEMGAAAGRRPTVCDYLGWLDTWQPTSAEEFFRGELGQVAGPTPLFGDDGETHRSCLDESSWPLVADQAARVRAAADELGVPPCWLVFAAWMAVVAAFRGEPDITIGALVNSRPDPMPHAIGPFTRLLPVVGRVDATPARTWAAQVCATLRETTCHAHLPTARINELSPVERGRLIFDSAVDVRDGAAPHRPVTGGQEMPLTVDVDAKLTRVRLRFDPTRVSRSLATRMARCTATAVSQIVGPHPVNAIALLDESSHDAVLSHNATAVPYPSDRCLHQLVESQVDRTPDLVALRFAGESLTYAELDRRANRLAGHLIDAGVRPDTIVGLCAEPGFDMVVAILAILKAGGAYAPLDPGFPEERLAYLAGDLDCEIVLVQDHLRHKLPQVADPVVVDRDGPWRNRPAERPVVPVTAGHLCYVMYTSGSTGRPKGVLVEHRGCVNFLSWMAGRYPLGPHEASLQWTAFSFDAAVWELFWPLMVGATAVIAPAGIHFDLAAFTRLIRAENVRTLHFVPAMLQTFLSAEDAGQCRSLRHVFVSGEPIPTALLDKFHRVLSADMINLYGVTEVSIDSTYYECPRGESLPFVRSGRPLHNTQTYVVDNNVTPVPFEARGEIFIGGDSVTRGYLGRPALTASRFVPDPFAGDGRRMYRTGDIATVLEDGHLRFFGRLDHQVKIRGIRVELLEVQSAVDAHPGVRESLVVPWGEGAARSLALYVVPSQAGFVERELREFLFNQLPSYLVPTAIITLAAFPLNANGKLDRSALPNPQLARTDVPDDARERTATEEAVARIWSEVLGDVQIGVTDDFFAVGGNSLLATRVIGSLRSQFGIDLPLRTWLESNSVAALATTIDRRRAELAAGHALLDELDQVAVAGRAAEPRQPR